MDRTTTRTSGMDREKVGLGLGLVVGIGIGLVVGIVLGLGLLELTGQELVGIGLVMGVGLGHRLVVGNGGLYGGIYGGRYIWRVIWRVYGGYIWWVYDMLVIYGGYICQVWRIIRRVYMVDTNHRYRWRNSYINKVSLDTSTSSNLESHAPRPCLLQVDELLLIAAGHIIQWGRQELKMATYRPWL